MRHEQQRKSKGGQGGLEVVELLPGEVRDLDREKVGPAVAKLITEMGRVSRFSKEGLNKGAWTKMEDNILKDYVQTHGEGKWSICPKKSGLNRCGKSCRLRWLNYLRPDIKRGNITEDEEELIVRLHKLLGNRWSLIAGRLPGRTDNEIKNYWNTIAAKKLQKFPSNFRRGSSWTLKNNKSLYSNGFNFDQEVIKTDAQSRNIIETQEPKDEYGFEPNPEEATKPPSATGKDGATTDFRLDDNFLAKFLGLEEDNEGDYDFSSEIRAGINEKISEASSSLISEEALMSPQLMLCESDFQSIASFLEEVELDWN